MPKTSDFATPPCHSLGLCRHFRLKKEKNKRKKVLVHSRNEKGVHGLVSLSSLNNQRSRRVGGIGWPQKSGSSSSQGSNISSFNQHRFYINVHIWWKSFSQVCWKGVNVTDVTVKLFQWSTCVEQRRKVWSISDVLWDQLVLTNEL